MARFPAAVCRPTPPAYRRQGDELCSLYGPDAASYGGAPASSLRVSIVDGAVAGWRAEVGWRDYEQVRDALRERYGAGAETAGIAATAGGARLPSRTWTASIGGAVATAIERSSPVTLTVIDIAAPALLARRSAGSSPASSDL